jgi:hypothetical protein
MRSLASKLGLSLALLLAWPLLGGGNQAQASFLVGSAGYSNNESGMMDGVVASESEVNQDVDQRRCPNLLARMAGGDPLAWAGLAHSGAGAAGASGSPSGGSSVLQAVALFSQVNLSPLSVVRWLYFEDVHYRPPPFSSRLFRPPRVSCDRLVSRPIARPLICFVDGTTGSVNCLLTLN